MSAAIVVDDAVRAVASHVCLTRITVCDALAVGRAVRVVILMVAHRPPRGTGAVTCKVREAGFQIRATRGISHANQGTVHGRNAAVFD